MYAHEVQTEFGDLSMINHDENANMFFDKVSSEESFDLQAVGNSGYEQSSTVSIGRQILSRVLKLRDGPHLMDTDHKQKDY